METPTIHVLAITNYICSHLSFCLIVIFPNLPIFYKHMLKCMKWKFSFSFCAVYLRETVSRMKKNKKQKKTSRTGLDSFPSVLDQWITAFANCCNFMKYLVISFMHSDIHAW